MTALAHPGSPGQPLPLVIVGAGAVVREYQGPAALEAERLGLLKVVGVVDRDVEQLARLGHLFPDALLGTDLSVASHAELALLATPPPTHSSLGLTLMETYGCHLLVEKPLAPTAAQARGLRTAAESNGRTLAVGHFRRFFPALETLEGLINSQLLGPVIAVSAQEGSLFRWPASAAFFSPESAGGGVTLDIGVHMLELLVAWLGRPEVVDYADDRMGGIEINSLAHVRWPSGARGEIRLSWDIALRNSYVIDFERGRATWQTGRATELLLELRGVPGVQRLTPCRRVGSRGMHLNLIDAPGYLGAFTAQLADVVGSIRQGTLPRVGQTAVDAVELISEMYSRRQAMDVPYLDEDERSHAARLGQLVAGTQ